MRKNILKKLSKYAALGAAGIACTNSDAAVIYTDVNPDSLTIGNGAYDVDLDNDIFACIQEDEEKLVDIDIKNEGGADSRKISAKEMIKSEYEFKSLQKAWSNEWKQILEIPTTKIRNYFGEKIAL